MEFYRLNDTKVKIINNDDIFYVYVYNFNISKLNDDTYTLKTTKGNVIINITLDNVTIPAVGGRNLDDYIQYLTETIFY